MTRDYFNSPCGHSAYVKSSLEDMNMLGLLLSVRIAHIACYSEFFLLHYKQILCQSRLCKADGAHLTYLMLQRQHIPWMVVSLTTSKCKPVIFSVSSFALFYTWNMFILMILDDICLLPAQFFHMNVYTGKVESRVQIADLCATLKNFQSCGEPSFIGTAVLRGRCLPLIARQGKCKSLLIRSMSYGWLV
jgi:hypothetical protein